MKQPPYDDPRPPNTTSSTLGRYTLVQILQWWFYNDSVQWYLYNDYM